MFAVCCCLFSSHVDILENPQAAKQFLYAAPAEAAPSEDPLHGINNGASQPGLEMTCIDVCIDLKLLNTWSSGPGL